MADTKKAADAATTPKKAESKKAEKGTTPAAAAATGAAAATPKKGGEGKNDWARGGSSTGGEESVQLEHRNVISRYDKDKLTTHHTPIPGMERKASTEQRETNTPLYMAGAFFTALGVFAINNVRKGKGASRGTMEARVAAQGIALVSIAGLGVYMAFSPRPARASPLSSLPSYYSSPMPRLAATPLRASQRTTEHDE